VTARPPRASTRSEGRTEDRGEGRGEPKPSAKADAKPVRRTKARGATHAEREDTARRSPSVMPTDRYHRIDDDDVLEVADLPAAEPGSVPRLRMLVLEAAPHLAAAQGAIVAAGHAVTIGASGRDGVDKLRFAVGEVDAMLVGMPGGEPLIELAAELGGRRPVVIAAWTASAVEAARRAPAAGADLATVRPHDVERLAPILLAASRLVELRRSGLPADGAAGAASTSAAPEPAPAPESAPAPEPAPASGGAGDGDGEGGVDGDGEGGVDAGGEDGDDEDGEGGIDVGGEGGEGGDDGDSKSGDDVGGAGGVDVDMDLDGEGDVAVDMDLDGEGDVAVDMDLDGEGEPDREPAGLLAAEAFAQAAQCELEHARRFGDPLAVAMFKVDVPPPPPPPGLRGILRARAGNALVHALRAADLATELDHDRFLVVMPHTERASGAEHARRIVSAVAAGDPVTAVGRTFPPRVIGAVVGAAGAELDLPRMVQDATQLLEQALVTGASLAVES
jgi:CheY-like chemotaxis protein